MSTPSISIIILTHNEAGNIADCLESVAWADDVIVLDSGSDDGTCDIARDALGAVRIYENAFVDFGQQRNWALDHCEPRHDWILFLDADERVTSALRDEMMGAVGAASDEVGYYLCYRNLFLGQWLKRCTFFPSWQLRLLKHGKVRFRKVGHGQREVTDGSLGFLQQPYDHLGFSKGIADWVDRHNRYSTQEAEFCLELARQPLKVVELFSGDALLRRRAIKRIYARVPARPLVRFFYTYILRLGFLDGRAGWTFCQLQFAHELNISAKQRELAVQQVDDSCPHYDFPESKSVELDRAREAKVRG